MSAQIIRSPVGFHDWFQTQAGQYVLDWEREQFDRVVADLFGYHALQLGLPQLDALRSSRIAHRWLALDAASGAPVGLDRGPGPEAVAKGLPGAPRLGLIADFGALPFAEHSLDLVLLPHSLDLSADPHATLREVHRVLVPEGRVVISGFNPASLWGLRQLRARGYRRLGFDDYFLPQSSEFIAPWRLNDWLRLLGFEPELKRYGVWRPAVRSERWLQRFEWMDRLGTRWWPVLGALYCVVAVKRVRGMKLLGPAWKSLRVAPSAPATVVPSLHRCEQARTTSPLSESDS